MRAPLPVILVLLLLAVRLQAENPAIEYKDLNGNSSATLTLPAFIISIHSQGEIPKAMRFATLIESLQNPPQWIFDFSPMQPSLADRLAARAQIKNPSMKSKCVVLKTTLQIDGFANLIAKNGRIVWQTDSMPGDDSWQEAVVRLRSDSSER